jgi:protein N-terminal methyltransferase
MTSAFDDDKDDFAGFRGSDTDENEYESVQELWKVHSEGWYEKAADYYQDQCEASLEGVLGGFASISPVDLQGSLDFVKSIQSSDSYETACECGAGIGRVTRGLLLPLGYKECHLVESCSRLLLAAPEYIGDGAEQCRFYCASLQEWTPTAKYDLIWIQWVSCYLTDTDAVAFLQRCKEALREGGMVVLKENVCNDEDFIVDVDDASLTRSLRYWKVLFKQSGLQIKKEMQQEDFPDQIFPVYMFALS